MDALLPFAYVRVVHGVVHRAHHAGASAVGVVSNRMLDQMRDCNNGNEACAPHESTVSVDSVTPVVRTSWGSVGSAIAHVCLGLFDVAPHDVRHECVSLASLV